MPEHKWINEHDDAGVVLATLADMYLEAQERTYDHDSVRLTIVEMKRRHLDEALAEFYVLHPYLTGSRPREVMSA